MADEIDHLPHRPATTSKRTSQDRRGPLLNTIFDEVTSKHPSWTKLARMAEAKRLWHTKHDAGFTANGKATP